MFGNMCLETLILVEFSYIFNKINDEKFMDLSLFLEVCIMCFLTLGTLKTSVFPR